MSKKKDDLLSFRAKVIEKRPSGMFEVEIIDNGHILLCTMSGKIRQNNIRISVGDEVDIEVSVYDLNRGRIIYRYKT
jgi:translation initiation factor IF-1